MALPPHPQCGKTEHNKIDKKTSLLKIFDCCKDNNKRRGNFFLFLYSWFRDALQPTKTKEKKIGILFQWGKFFLS